MRFCILLVYLIVEAFGIPWDVAGLEEFGGFRIYPHCFLYFYPEVH